MASDDILAGFDTVAVDHAKDEQTRVVLQTFAMLLKGHTALGMAAYMGIKFIDGLPYQERALILPTLRKKYVEGFESLCTVFPPDYQADMRKAMQIDSPVITGKN